MTVWECRPEPVARARGQSPRLRDVLHVRRYEYEGNQPSQVGQGCATFGLYTKPTPGFTRLRTCPRVWIHTSRTCLRVWIHTTRTCPRVWIHTSRTCPRVWIHTSRTCPCVWIHTTRTCPCVWIHTTRTCPRVWIHTTRTCPCVWIHTTRTCLRVAGLVPWVQGISYLSGSRVNSSLGYGGLEFIV